jgi:flagellar hook-basal body complex protein FliE
MNRFGNQQYDRFSKSKAMTKHFNPSNPREMSSTLKYDFTQNLANLYPSIQKYQQKSQPQMVNATTIISNEILRPVWYAAKQLHERNPQIIDTTAGINYVDFKNYMMDDIFTTPLSQQYNDFANLKPKRKTDIMNSYFDEYLSKERDQLFQRTITGLILLKSQRNNIPQNSQQILFRNIYDSFDHPVQAEHLETDLNARDANINSLAEMQQFKDDNQEEWD